MKSYTSLPSNLPILEPIPSKLGVRVTQADLSRIPSTNLCRICQLSGFCGEDLLSPCKCKGSLAYVHLTCLEKWLNQSGRNSCELCGFEYNSERRPKYTFKESVRLWLRVPANRAQIQSDILIGVLLTLVTIGLVAVCLIGMEYFVIEGRRLGISEELIKGGLFLFLAVILVGYFITMFLLIRDQVTPWYNWWKRSVNVRLRLTSSVLLNAVRYKPEDFV